MDVLATLRALMRAASPRIDYYATYFGKVVSWAPGSQTVDVTPSDPRLPGMAGVPFRHGLPGTVVDVDSGTSVAITWLNGDPSQPIAFLWGGGEHVKQLVLNADQIVLGGDGAEPAAKGQTLQNYLESLARALAAHTHVSGGAGAPTSPADTTPTDLLETRIKPPTLTATNVYVK
jgi:hypothetical protein